MLIKNVYVKLLDNDNEMRRLLFKKAVVAVSMLDLHRVEFHKIFKSVNHSMCFKYFLIFKMKKIPPQNLTKFF